ncbi:MAG: hypothetical protein FJ033_08365 [Chloroflexi bacterium]|nr:hypothetical protein [Chloroflexota bacterium]
MIVCSRHTDVYVPGDQSGAGVASGRGVGRFAGRIGYCAAIRPGLMTPTMGEYSFPVVGSLPVARVKTSSCRSRLLVWNWVCWVASMILRRGTNRKA